MTPRCIDDDDDDDDDGIEKTEHSAPISCIRKWLHEIILSTCSRVNITPVSTDLRTERLQFFLNT